MVNMYDYYIQTNTEEYIFCLNSSNNMHAKHGDPADYLKEIDLF